MSEDLRVFLLALVGPAVCAGLLTLWINHHPPTSLDKPTACTIQR